MALLREKNTKDIASIIQGVSQEDRDWLLISSAKRGQARMVDLLLNHSYFDSNICGLAFERACEAGQLEVAKKLVKDKFIPENYKKTAFDKAVKNEHDHVVQHLFPAMQSKQNIPSTPQRTYLPMQKSVNPKKSTLETNEISDPLEIILKSYRVSKL